MTREELTIKAIQTAMQSGDLTSEELVRYYLKRIAAYNPYLNAVLEVNADAMAIAQALDTERQLQTSRGPLHGIPVLLKDNIDTGDTLHTSAGSLALAGSYAIEDSFIAKRIRDAGGIIMGKANMTEWANFMTDGMPSGFSSRGGQVLNPYGPNDFDVGGSSSGSGAAVSANLTMLAIGTETSGSILSPSSENAIVGIKPTVGLISRTGIIPISHSQDTPGPMARTVRDAATLLDALTGADNKDPITLAGSEMAADNYTQYLDEAGLKSARIGVVRKGIFDQKELTESAKAVIEDAIEQMKHAGAQIVDPADIPAADKKWDQNVMVHEFKSDLNAYLSKLAPDQPHTLQDVIKFNMEHSQDTLKYGQSLLLASEDTSGTLSEPEYLTSRLNDLQWSQNDGIDAVMDNYNLDALLSPANAGADIPARAGYPSITVPGGFTNEGQPLNVTFTGKAYSEPALIRLAYAFEQATNHRESPGMLSDGRPAQ
ncbi:amidase family protein [Barrientosiimonas marina]|uniref:Amidase family protein n=1 Tax=Lentibacillus kimchii TaxID=1542911 RepID=A0ABW2UUR4_9BACI